MEQKGPTPRERSDRLYTHFIDHLEELALVSIYGWNVEISKITGQSIASTDSVDVGERNTLRRRSGPNHDQRKYMKRKLWDCANRFWDQAFIGRAKRNSASAAKGARIRQVEELGYGRDYLRDRARQGSTAKSQQLGVQQTRYIARVASKGGEVK
ncbi:hypothetical protein E5D57_001587 [Metarhizium anisopliae]|nr:hypothetical protein E5D57_001587 [Metarhizium anisopliae]